MDESHSAPMHVKRANVGIQYQSIALANWCSQFEFASDNYYAIYIDAFKIAFKWNTLELNSIEIVFASYLLIFFDEFFMN